MLWNHVHYVRPAPEWIPDIARQGTHFRVWHEAAEEGQERLVRCAWVIRTSTGSAMAKTSSSSMQLASDHMSGPSKSDVLKDDAASRRLVSLRLMLVSSHPWSLARCSMATVSSARIQQRFQTAMRSGEKSTSAFRADRPYSREADDPHFGFVPEGDVVSTAVSQRHRSESCPALRDANNWLDPGGREPMR